MIILKKLIYFSVIALNLSLGSCSDSNLTNSSRGPIVLDDKTTIVTETDSTYLQDLVLDLEDVKTEEVAVQKLSKDTLNVAKINASLDAQDRKDSILNAQKLASEKVALEKENKKQEATNNKKKSRKEIAAEKRAQEKEDAKKKNRHHRN